ncbi:MAG TPA: iron-sulfur cluster assembly protein [Candidatus Nanoarchaeia archaeon]|nr:iron-sulfur cluster assembly protein [Candidatus Nanoarchaeia archaeon]
MIKKEPLTKEQLIEQVFKKYEDPELMIDVWTLGLIYEIKIEGNKVHVLLTFTSPMCPFGPQMVDELTSLIKKEGAAEVDIKVTFEPPWQPSEELREMMGV